MLQLSAMLEYFAANGIKVDDDETDRWIGRARGVTDAAVVIELIQVPGTAGLTFGTGRQDGRDDQDAPVELRVNRYPLLGACQCSIPAPPRTPGDSCSLA